MKITIIKLIIIIKLEHDQLNELTRICICMYKPQEP